MKEVRSKCGHALLRVLYAFDPLRAAILLIGGDKVGNPKWYEQLVPLADELFDKHLETIKIKTRHKK